MGRVHSGSACWVGWLAAALALTGCGAEGPRVIGLHPQPGSVGLPLDTPVEVGFDRALLSAGEGAAGLVLSVDGQALPAEIFVSPGDRSLVLTPERLLLPGRTYEARLIAGAAVGLDGAESEDERRWSFSTVSGCLMEPEDIARQPAGPAPDGSVVIPGGRRIAPTGALIPLGSFPSHALAWPDRPLAVAVSNGYGLGSGKRHQLDLIDLQSDTILQTIARPRPGALFYGLALSTDGSRLYAAGGEADLVEVFELAPDGHSLEAVAAWPVDGFPGGLLLDEARGRLYVAAQLGGEVVALALADGAELKRVRLGIAPYDLVLSADGRSLYASLWGRPELYQPGQVIALDAETLAVRQRIDVGKNPEELALASDGRLFVACSDSDRVDVIDTARDVVIAGWELRRSPLDPVGLSPTALALDEERGRLYVACSQRNAIDVFDIRTGIILGSLSAGWYPTSVTLAPGDRLLVTNGKGLGSGPNLDGADAHHYQFGNLQIVAAPSDEDLLQGAREVQDNQALPLSFFPRRCLGQAFPIPRSPNEPSPIRHVIFVLRENKTYDQNLGDLEGTNGDPSLVMFGESLTPNLHALAREFCNLDNFHADIEVSVQGHYWNVAGTINDYAEKVWQAGYRDDSRIPATGTLQPDYPAGLFVWHKLQEAGIDFRDYGEPMGLAGEYGRFESSINMDYMLDLGLNLYSQPDAVRVGWFWQEVEAGIFPPFVFLALLNDHTYGSSPGQPTPQWMVAENDYATGLLVERVSHSEHWADTLIIVTEDDPQSGADHVDAHRSIALLISPFTRRGYTSSVHYGFSSLIRTYGLILGMPALNILDELASPVYDCFTAEPDLTPYDARPNTTPYDVNPQSAPGALESLHMDFSAPDRARGLGSVLWWSTRPGEPLPPQLLEDLDEEAEEAELAPWPLPIPLGSEVDR